MRNFINRNISLIKAILFILFGIVAVFVDFESPVRLWSWVSFFALAISLVGLEIHQHLQSNISPINKVIKYLLHFDGWAKSGDSDYYITDSEFKASPLDSESNFLGFNQEWVRGEIGYHYQKGNSAYYVGVFKSNLLLHKIHIVIFDGGKKNIVAPSWVPVGSGRFYFYLKSNIEYVYQCYLSHEVGKDYSRDIRRSDCNEVFDIPVLDDEAELKKFITFCNESASEPETDEHIQTELFLKLLEKYSQFKQGKCL